MGFTEIVLVVFGLALWMVFAVVLIWALIMLVRISRGQRAILKRLDQIDKTDAADS